MSEEKKSFFASLSPKSAAIVGVVAGVLVIGTVGFLIMLAVYFGGAKSADKSDTGTPSTAGQPSADSGPVAQAPKSDKPVVELFVMSYCPYGLQMEKAYTPVVKLLGAKADMSVKFVSYAMHGQKEVEENTRQYCIETEQGAKYLNYLDCFALSGDSATCLKSNGVDEAKMTTCVNDANKKYGIMDLFNDQSKWLSGRYPIYPVHQDLNDKYGVQGSPTLVINGQQVEANRSPEAIKKVVCAAFNNAPSECAQTLSAGSAAPGFGGGSGDGAANANCGS